MTPIDPAELSGLLDGELPPARAAALRAAMAGDPALQAAYEALAGDDLVWRRAAREGQFTPAVALPAGRAAWDSAAVLTGILAALLLVRGFSKVPDAMAWGLAAQAVALCAVLAWVGHLVLASEEGQEGRFVLF